MDSKDIIKGIENFFKTADEQTLAEVNTAFSIEIEGDVSLEEYLSEFNNEYFYSRTDDSKKYSYSDKHLIPSSQYYQQISFESAVASYEESDIVITPNIGSENKGQVAKMIKTAA